MFRIVTTNGRERMSTKELSLAVAAAVREGARDIFIQAAGQHDIASALWTEDGSRLNFEVVNPGQRLGGACLPGVRVVARGSSPADVGWLNSGGEIVVQGDAGDTAGHCAAAGKIYIGGRAGTRSGSLMKHDPECEPPELWILKTTGSFSFEFMSGGRAVVCGHECPPLESALGDRPCVGMVGGVVYFRGATPSLPEDVEVAELDAADVEFLDTGLDDFLKAIAKPQIKRDLSVWKQWRKIVPASGENRREPESVGEYRENEWFAGGLFGDVLEDDFGVAPLAPVGDLRLRVPLWENGEHACVDCRTCLLNCPQNAVRRRERDGDAVYEARARSCVGCGICAAVCPKAVWKMKSEI